MTEDVKQKLAKSAMDAGWDEGIVSQLGDMLDLSRERREAIINPWSARDYEWGEQTMSPQPMKNTSQPGVDRVIQSGGMSTASGPVGPMSHGVIKSGPSTSGAKFVFGDVSPRITQRAGARHSRYDNISGGVNRGTDFAVPSGTPIFAPEGTWVVQEAFGGAPNQPNAKVNNGYGNSVVLVNENTGERVRMSHLSGVGVKPGQRINSGQPIGASGMSGHATGAHLDVEYIDAQGRLRDILSSPYGGNFYGGK